MKLNLAAWQKITQTKQGEKHNNSNDPNETQPVDEKSRYAEKKELAGKALDLSNIAPYLDKSKLADISDDEAQRLMDAIALMNAYEAKKKEYDSLNDQVLYNIYKNQEIRPEDIPSKKQDGTLQKKLDYFQNVIDNPESHPGSVASSQQKLSALKEMIERSEKMESLGLSLMKNDYDSAKALVGSYEDAGYAYSEKAKSEAVFCKNYQESLKVLGEYANKALESMTADEKKYIDYWAGSGYHQITEPLIGTKYQGGKSNGNFEKMVRSITSAIDKAKIPCNIWLHRYTGDLYDVSEINSPITHNNTYHKSSIQSFLSKGGSPSDLVGRVFRNKTFMATAASQGGGWNSGHYDPNYKFSYFNMKIYVPKGTKGLWLPPTGTSEGENEMLLQRGGVFRITKAKANGYVLEIEAELVSEASSEELEKDLQEAKKYA